MTTQSRNNSSDKASEMQDTQEQVQANSTDQHLGRRKLVEALVASGSVLAVSTISVRWKAPSIEWSFLTNAYASPQVGKETLNNDRIPGETLEARLQDAGGNTVNGVKQVRKDLPTDESIIWIEDIRVAPQNSYWAIGVASGKGLLLNSANPSSAVAKGVMNRESNLVEDKAVINLTQTVSEGETIVRPKLPDGTAVTATQLRFNESINFVYKTATKTYEFELAYRKHEYFVTPNTATAKGTKAARYGLVLERLTEITG